MFFYLVWFAGFNLLVWKNQVGQILRHAKINIGWFKLLLQQKPQTVQSSWKALETERPRLTHNITSHNEQNKLEDTWWDTAQTSLKNQSNDWQTAIELIVPIDFILYISETSLALSPYIPPYIW